MFVLALLSTFSSQSSRIVFAANLTEPNMILIFIELCGLIPSEYRTIQKMLTFHDAVIYYSDIVLFVYICQLITFMVRLLGMLPTYRYSPVFMFIKY